MAKRNVRSSNTAERLDEIMEHVCQTRMLVEVIESHNRATAEATLAYRDALDARIEDLRRDLTARLDVLELAVRQNSADIQKNSADIQTLQRDVRDLRTEVSRLATKAELENLERRVSALEARVR